jgi:hypothetical protein
MQTRSFLLSLGLVAGLAACGSLSQPDAEALGRAQQDPDLMSDVGKLAQAGWEIQDLSQARIDHPTAANGDAWTRVRIAVTRDALAGELLLGWSEHDAPVVALSGHDAASGEALERAVLDDPADAVVADEDAEADAGAQADAVAAAACGHLGTACTSSTTCCTGSTGLTCFGPDHHETCQCGAAQRFTVKYFEAATVSTVCFVLPDNPTGAGYWIRTRTGCGPGLCRTGKGCGVSCPANVTSTNKALSCGIYGGRC